MTWQPERKMRLTLVNGWGEMDAMLSSNTIARWHMALICPPGLELWRSW